MTVRDALVALLVTIMWGSAFVVVELGLKEFTPIFNAALRFFFAAIPLIFFINRKSIPWKWILIIGMTFVLMFIAMYTGMQIGMPAGLTSLVLQGQVLFTVVLAAIILKDRPTGWQKTGVIIGVAGISMIAMERASPDAVLAFMLVVIASFFYGLISIWMKKVGQCNMLSLIVWVSLIPPLPLLMLSLIFETGQWESFINMSAVGAFSIFYTAILGTVVPFMLWGWLLRKYSPHIVSPFALLIPVIGMLTAWILLDERFTSNEIASSVVILAGLLIVVWGQKLFNWSRYSMAEFAAQRK